MATISSHVLNAVHGTHAGGVRVECSRIDKSGEKTPVFEVKSATDGRIAAEFEAPDDSTDDLYELIFHTGEYFDQQGLPEQVRIMPTVVFRLVLPDPNARYHVPVIASPHGYSVWWSN